MKRYSNLNISSMWSTNKLKMKAENIINEKATEGYEIISVAVGINIWGMPTAFITIRK